ncbi:phenylalanine--tRNA ligase subunit beta [Pseudomonadota bacterium]
MLISLNWLRDFVDIPSNIDAQEFGKLFTLRTAEVEGVKDLASSLENVVVGQIEKIKPHPDADKLQITETTVGGKPLQIICGATNIKEGMYVAVAKIGAKIRWHGEGELVTLEKAKIRGVESSGMICAASEIGLPDEEGIMDLTPYNPKIGQNVAEVLKLNDVILDIDNKSLTHRPDLWGHYGIAREVAAITDKKLSKYEPKVSYPGSGEKVDIKVEDTELCPRYIGVRIDGIKVGPSPDWLKERVEGVGYRSINNIVDVTNYVMAELGQPLHAFDTEKIDGGIVVRRAKNGEEIQTLDEDKKKLTSDMLVIADHTKPVAIAGVMGGLNSEISDSTASIIIESANFHPSNVRKTAAAIGLRTEAVQRFEKSLDPVMAETAIDKTCELILKICESAKIAGPKNDVKNYSEKTIEVTLDLGEVNTKIGKDIEEKQALDILNSLEFKAESKGKGKIHVEVPSFRATKDVEIEDDLVEEIARLYGYENIDAELPELPIRLPEENTERKRKHEARNILSFGLGFNEVYNYSFYSLREIQKCMLPEELHIKVENYLSEDQTHMRISQVPNMLRNVADNLKNYERFKIYEIGRTYEDLQEYFPIEEKKITGFIVVPKKDKGDVFYDAKGALEKFLRTFGTPELVMKKGESLTPYAHPNKYAEYYAGGTKDGDGIAKVFEVHPLVLKNFDIESVKIGAFDINFTKLVALGKGDKTYTPIPRFPGTVIDVSVLVDKEIPVAELEKAIYLSDSVLVRSVELFDLYEGENIPASKKALAFKIVLRSDERTLKDEEIKTVQEEIFTRLKKLGGEIRGL